MTQLPSITTILQLGPICQYLASAAVRNNTYYNGKPVNKGLPALLFIETSTLQWMYTHNPNNSTITGVANYLYSLEAPFAQQAQTILNNQSASKPVITGPSNQSVLSGENAVFSVTVVSVLPVTYQWYKNGVLIPGATGASYTFLDAQLSDSGSVFDVIVTNSIGSATSNNATLTVTASLLGYAYYGTTDYSADLLGGNDDVPYSFNFPITSGQPLEVQFPITLNGEYMVVKYPSTESTKVNYNNPPIDSGPIPSISLEGTTIASWKYVFSRGGNPFTTNPPNLLTLS